MPTATVQPASLAARVAAANQVAGTNDMRAAAGSNDPIRPLLVRTVHLPHRADADGLDLADAGAGSRVGAQLPVVAPAAPAPVAAPVAAVPQPAPVQQTAQLRAPVQLPVPAPAQQPRTVVASADPVAAAQVAAPPAQVAAQVTASVAAPVRANIAAVAAPVVQPVAAPVARPSPKRQAPSCARKLTGHVSPVHGGADGADRRGNHAHGGWMIQIGAFDDEDQAKQHLSDAQVKVHTTLAAADPFTERVQKGDKALFRARFAGFDKTAAESACKELKRSDFECMALKD